MSSVEQFKYPVMTSHVSEYHRRLPYDYPDITVSVPVRKPPKSPAPEANSWGLGETVKKLYGLDSNPARKLFLDEYLSFMKTRGVTLSKIPVVAKLPLDLFRLYHVVKQFGGFSQVVKKRRWSRVVRELDLPSSITSAAFTLRTQYMRLLYPFECEKKGIPNNYVCFDDEFEKFKQWHGLKSPNTTPQSRYEDQSAPPPLVESKPFPSNQYYDGYYPFQRSKSEGIKRSSSFFSITDVRRSRSLDIEHMKRVNEEANPLKELCKEQEEKPPTQVERYYPTESDKYTRKPPPPTPTTTSSESANKSHEQYSGCDCRECAIAERTQRPSVVLQRLPENAKTNSIFQQPPPVKDREYQDYYDSYRKDIYNSRPYNGYRPYQQNYLPQYPPTDAYRQAKKRKLTEGTETMNITIEERTDTALALSMIVNGVKYTGTLLSNIIP